MTSASANRRTGLDIEQFIDAHPISPMQWLLLAQCFAVVAIDGFDTASIVFIAPPYAPPGRSRHRNSHHCSGPVFSVLR